MVCDAQIIPSALLYPCQVLPRARALALVASWTRAVPARHAVEAHCCSRVVLSKVPSTVPRVGQMSLAHAQGTTRLPGTCSRQAG